MVVFMRSNEGAEIVPAESTGIYFGSLLTPPRHSIVRYASFYEDIFPEEKTEMSHGTFSTPSTIELSDAIERIHSSDELGRKLLCIRFNAPISSIDERLHPTLVNKVITRIPELGR